MAHPLRISWLARVATLLAVAIGPASALAADAPDDVADARGNLYGDTVVLPSTRDKVGEGSPKAVRPGVIFVNFAGVTTMMGADNSKIDSSSIFGQSFDPFGGDQAAHTAVVDAVHMDFSAYDIEIVEERPASGDYTMAVVSPTNPAGGSVLGIAPLDCHDGMPNNVVFAFHGAGDMFGPSGVAGTISHEVGHSYGLEHVNDGTDIMNPSNSGGDPTFHDTCTQLVDPAVVCGAAHTLFCPEGTTQNSHQELLEIFGSSTPDTLAPVVTITTPGNNQGLDVGEPFRIEVTASDDDEVRTVNLLLDGEPLMSDTEAPFGWDIVNIPEGVFELSATATDRVGNEGLSDVVTIYVGIEPPEAEDTSGGTDGGAGQDGGGGCGCTQSRDSMPALAMGVLALALVCRRRR